MSFLAALVLFGGASRADALTQPFIRLFSIGVIGFAVWNTARDSWTGLRVPLGLLSAFAVLCVIQLLPLPPSVWPMLPGRSTLAEALLSAGLPLGWRPWSLAPDGTINTLLATLPAFALLAMIVLIGPGRLHLSIPILIGLVLVCLGFGLLQITAGGPYFYSVTNRGTPVGFFANRNHAALLLAMVFPLLAAWVLTNKNRQENQPGRLILAGVIALLVPAMLLVNGSRGGLLAGGVGLLGAAALFYRNRRNLKIDKKARIMILGFAGLSVIILLAFILTSNDLALTRLLGDGGPEVRAQALPTLWLMAKAYLPFGSGLGSFDQVFRIFEPDFMISSKYFNHAHNDYLELLIEGGVFTVGLLAIAAIWILKRFVVIWRSDGGSANANLAFCATIMLVQIMLFSVFDYPVRTPFIMALAAYCAACMSRFTTD
ncbi:O-antigen ligase family protein [Allopontixanthobacter sediminis]|uniref:O-antigen ligase-related domain-containing protein n=1 Tax=Allopontixanthobacter sediminis TaxID=1689985 RepID=A0A845B2P4_9SPHN|nr:hypothetical protein [Allopontixanthobacter sediminis]